MRINLNKFCILLSVHLHELEKNKVSPPPHLALEGIASICEWGFVKLMTGFTLFDVKRPFNWRELESDGKMKD